MFQRHRKLFWVWFSFASVLASAEASADRFTATIKAVESQSQLEALARHLPGSPGSRQPPLKLDSLEQQAALRPSPEDERINGGPAGVLVVPRGGIVEGVADQDIGDARPETIGSLDIGVESPREELRDQAQAGSDELRDAVQEVADEVIADTGDARQEVEEAQEDTAELIGADRDDIAERIVELEDIAGLKEIGKRGKPEDDEDRRGRPRRGDD